ncbi:23S rRNA (adenine(2503)-C(2))-methyltransferase RlmN [Candidatus Uhrbacteria bacterium]|nr:23S rRNA (adenine(2503)-C(2))-methyltransferase RlmN [Candidatus Uhrbacteria bacterium]
MNIDAVQKTLDDRREPAFRLAQAKRAFYVELQGGWENLSTFPKALREALEEQVPWDSLKAVTVQSSKRGDTDKVLFSCADGQLIEAVLMRSRSGRNTVCVSSQAGCPMGCSFCATGAQGFKRNLTADEIVEQVIFFARRLKAEGAHVTNVVFMGMGEPFNNYDSVMQAVRMLNDPDGFGLGARHITVSTCGIVPGIKKMADEDMQVNLAISLHSADDRVRTQIMPVNKAYPLNALMDALDEYTAKTNRKVMFEYLLLEDVNDSDSAAHELAELLGHNARLYQVNLIKYHDTGKFKASGQDTRDRFMQILRDRGIPVTFRVSFGEDIKAACGQLAGLAGNKKDEEE